MKREDLGPLLKGDRPTKTKYVILFQRKLSWLKPIHRDS